MFDVSNIRCNKHSVVSNERESLPDYIRRVVNERGLTYREVARRSGGGITAPSISAIISGQTRNIKSSTITALAKGLGVSAEEVFAIARGKSTSGDLQLNEIRLLEYFRALPAERQGDALIILEAISQRYGNVKSEDQPDVGSRPVYQAIAGKPKSLKGKDTKKSKKE